MEISDMATVVNMKDWPDLRVVLDSANEHGDVVRIDRRTCWGRGLQWISLANSCARSCRGGESGSAQTLPVSLECPAKAHDAAERIS